MSPRCLPLIALWLAQAIAAPGAAAAAAPARRSAADDSKARTAAAVTALRGRGDDKSLATAALVSQSADALVLATRAADLAPEDTAIDWIQLRVCALTPNCDNRAFATEMRWLDPDNSAAWLPTLAAAWQSADTVEIDRVLAHMARGTSVDFYWNRIVVMMFDALKAVSGRLSGRFAASDAARLAYVEHIAAVKIIPRFAPLIDACRQSKSGTPRRASCVTVARILRNGDTVNAQFAGIAIERRLLPVDGREYRSLGERRRVLQWRVMTAAEFDRPLLPWLKSAHARWRLSRMRTTRREQDVILAVLRDHGMPLDPPPPPPPPTPPPAPPEPLHLQPP
ncbi:MAG TPA: hypothetical protein VMV25_11025 [Steroidobacteraceae bacterium]|nr:hypothetical protein [Steroidobacteraceae bacterium]